MIALLRDDHVRADTILPGDALSVLQTLPDGIVQTCITSPPYYALRDYGIEGQIGLENTPNEYVARLVEVFREVRRVLRNDGTLWLNLGDSYVGYKGEKYNQSQHRGTGEYSPVPMCHEIGTPHTTGLGAKQLLGIPWRVAFALQGDGWILRSDIIWHKSNAMPESVKDRPTKSHEYLFLLSKSERYYYDYTAILEPQVTTSERHYAKRIKQEHKHVAAFGTDSWARTKVGFKNMEYNPNGRNKRSVWTVSTVGYPGAHFATFPPKLVEPCILAGSRPGDLVLDPFAGAGTTLLVAKQQGRSYLGVELNPEYITLAEKRLSSQPGLWEVKA
jgi:DNA modification methylase